MEGGDVINPWAMVLGIEEMNPSKARAARTSMNRKKERHWVSLAAFNLPVVQRGRIDRDTPGFVY